jgi:hypothetical protein
MAPKIFPKKHEFLIVAEYIRQELGNKFSILGAYADRQILFVKGTALPTTIPLGFYFLFKDGEGDFDLKFRVINPVNAPIIPGINIGKTTKNSGQAMTIVISIPAIIIQTIGHYQIELYLDNQPYKDSFDVSIQP